MCIGLGRCPADAHQEVRYRAEAGVCRHLHLISYLVPFSFLYALHSSLSPGVGDSIRGLQFSSDDEEGGGRPRPAPRGAEGGARSPQGGGEEELDGAPVIRADDEDDDDDDEDEEGCSMDTCEAPTVAMETDTRTEPPSEGSEMSTQSESGLGTGELPENLPVGRARPL